MLEFYFEVVLIYHTIYSFIFNVLDKYMLNIVDCLIVGFL